MTTPPSWWLSGLLASAIAAWGWRRGSLQRNGAFAAAGLGALALRTGWGWGLYLILWFALATLVSRLGRRTKATRLAAVVAKDDQRDLWQVLANGGLFALCASALWLPYPPVPPDLVAVAGAASLAATGADTWSTELGTWLGGTPWSFRTGGRVPPGSSGAVTVAGSVGGVSGALVLAGAALAVGLIPQTAFLSVALGGVAGAVADTLIGAWWQADRWCPVCETATERPVHRCGTATSHARGLRWLDNDRVNLLCGAVGALTAVVLTAVVLTA